MFYAIYERLCNEKGEKVTTVAEKLGINKANVSMWKKNGYTPRGEILSKIANYFNVTTDYLLGNTPIPLSKETEEKYIDIIKKLLVQRGIIQPDEELTEEKANKLIEFIEKNYDFL